MSSGIPQDLLRIRNDVEHRNWYAVGCAVNVILGDGLRNYAETKMKELHALLTRKVGGPSVGCTCKCTPGMKRNPHARAGACLWAQELRKLHIFKKKSDIPWHQSDSNKWHDPVDGYWEIAKLFMSNLGDDYAKVTDPSSTDVAPLLNLFRFCKHFKVQNALLKAVTDRRNQCAHAPNERISDTDKKAAFQDIKLLMKDLELVTSKEVQECGPLIAKTEEADLVILEENQVRILEEYRRIKECEDSQLKKQLIEEIRFLKEVLNKTFIFIFTVLLFLMSRAWSKIPAFLHWFFTVIYLLTQVGEKGGIVSDGGCSSAMIKSPISHFHFQQFDFSSYLVYKREGFVGRKWFFLELENIFETDRGATGVLITGEPGSGKTALMSQLICSRHSRIHGNIIGYHLCEYSEKGKRDGARFVRNLVDQIAARWPEYSQHVEENEQIRRELDILCQQDPTGCFFTTILGPLRVLNQPDGLRFIVIDALDECFESDKTSEIVEILHNKIVHFPKWLKVILTSRNFTTVTSRMPQVVRRTPLYATDKRNVKDIRAYVSRFLRSQNSFFVDRLLTAMNIGTRKDVMKVFLDKVITRAEGNFLFVKTTLQYMNDTDGGFDLQSLPTSLFDLYSIFFNRQFGKDGFRSFRSLFEVFLAACSPLHLDDVEEILGSEYEAEDVRQRIEQVSCFLRFGQHDGTVRIYHQSFAEWLINQTTVIHINKTRGHQNIAKFLLQRTRERNGNATFSEFTELFIHVLSGRTLEMHAEAMDRFNITEMREPRSNRSILHHLATQPPFYVPVLDFFVRKFKTVDVLDASKKTPAFYAAYEGFAENLRSLVNGGADVSSFLEGFAELNAVAVAVRNTGIEDFSLMHAAAAKGYTDVVELLIKSNISFPESSKSYPTPLHLAAGNGRLDVVRLFHDYGAKFDVITLHHAAARNHLDVVEFLLNTVGVRDSCLPCLSKPEHLSRSNPTAEDVHLYFCETALHAAVSRGYFDVLKILLAFGKGSLECQHHSGKTVLMDAVERNDIEMVDLLLENGANVTTECGIKMSWRSKKAICKLASMYQQDFFYTMYCVEDSCKCGNRAIHMSARYGLWQVAEKLIRERVFDLTDVNNCAGRHALDVAIAHGHTHFLHNTNETYENHGSILRDSALVARATQHCTVNAVKHILNYPINYIYEHRWELLLDVVNWFPNLYYKVGAISPNICPGAFQDENISLGVWIQRISEKHLAIMKLLIESYNDKSFILNKKDADRMTLLHHAAKNGFEDAVKYLVEIGADTRVKNRDGESPLKLALIWAAHNPPNSNASYRCYTTNDGRFGSCNTTSYDEIVRYLILSQRSSISKCNAESEYILNVIIGKQMPLSLYAVLKAGVDMNCKVHEPISPFLRHLRLGGRQLSEVFKIFEIGVSVECGASFTSSELHLMFYSSSADDMGNFFSPVNKGRSLLQRLIDQHPEGLGILNKCYDAEGYLPIHRAAQGGNLAAIKWSKRIGVNTRLKTRSGLTALDISILYLGNISKAELIAESIPFKSNFLVPLTASKYRNQVFEELLRMFFNETPEYSSQFPCGPTLKRLSPLHIAAVKGMTVLEYVHKKASEIFPNLPLNCVNKHRLDPVYIVYFYNSLRNEGLTDSYSEDFSVGTKYGSKESKKMPLKNSKSGGNGHDSGLPCQYPVRIVDYHMAFNYLYLSSRFDGEPNQMLHVDMPSDIHINECPGYNDTIPKFEESVPPVDFTECSKITVNHGCYQPLCEHEMLKEHFRKYPCPTLVQRLRTWFFQLSNPRQYRQISRFIAERLGWEDVPGVKDIQNRWPLFFLHKKLLNKYASFEYLKILNEAFEVADVRFRKHFIYHTSKLH